MHLQLLTITLDGITAGDYLAWVCDPEPAALGAELRSIRVQADPAGDTIDVTLTWTGSPRTAALALAAAGLPLTPDLRAVVEHRLAAAA
jgi:hypothetical protein